MLAFSSICSRPSTKRATDSLVFGAFVRAFCQGSGVKLEERFARCASVGPADLVTRVASRRREYLRNRIRDPDILDELRIGRTWYPDSDEDRVAIFSRTPEQPFRSA